MPANTQPTDAPVSPAGPRRVALVMIARDEAPRIARALASARPWVDALVVLDTGSHDDTVARAQAAGAHVGHFTWIDDFAAARNAALALAEQATGAHWCLMLDADEWIDAEASGGAPALQALFDGLRRPGPPPAHVGLLRVLSDYDTPQGIAQAMTWLPRLLPRGVRYEGRIHEHPVHALPTQRLPLVLGHDGYRDQALAAKAGRNAALLQAALAEQPDDAYLHYQLGKDHDAYGRWAEAAACHARSRACDPAAAATGPGWWHDRAVREIHALKACGRHEDGLQRAEAGMDAWADSPDFWFALGDLMLDWAAEAPQRAGELLPMIEAAWLRCLEIGERPDLEGSVHGRGSHLARRNLQVLYEGTGRPDEAARMRAPQAHPAPHPAGIAVL